MTTKDEHHQVWDLPVRLFHWTLVASVVGAFVTNKLGVSYFKYHVLCGYSVIVLIAFRLVWGVVGTRHARFWNFLRGPRETVGYALAFLRGEGRHYPGHNPLGALMVVALLVGLGTQAALGLFGNDEIFNYGPLYGYVANDVSLQLTSLHRKLFYFIPIAVALHVLAIIAHRIVHRENLVKPMITGRKPSHVLSAADAINSSRIWLAIVLVVGLAGGLAWVVLHAPVADSLI